MSINAIRALVLLGNVLLIGLIMWVCYGTFVTVDKDRYYVQPPDPRKFLVAEIQGDERQEKRELYKAIARVFDRAPPVVEAPPPVAAKPPEPTLPDPRQIQVLAIQFSPTNAQNGSAFLKAGGGEPRFFQVGMDLGAPGLGLEIYRDVKLKAVTADAVIVLDQKGQEVKLPMVPKS